jgi:hypothetical protein
MALIDQYNLAYSGNLPKRVCAACWTAAVNILNEDAGTANHANRVLWAKAALQEAVSGTMVKRITVDCAQNASIAAAGEAATDNDIQFIVNSRAGVYADGVYGA